MKQKAPSLIIFIHLVVIDYIFLLIILPSSQNVNFYMLVAEEMQDVLTRMKTSLLRRVFTVLPAEKTNKTKP